MPQPNSHLLAQTVDDHIGWLSTWHRLAFLDFSQRSAQAENLAAPSSFVKWQQQAASGAGLPDQPAVEQLAQLHEQLHTMARLVMMKTPNGRPVAADDYDNVIGKYNDLMQGLRRMERAFSEAASGLDVLTGLRSRIGMQDDLMREYKRFLRGGKPFCIALMDIDHFKKINDTHGHDAGDRILASVADHISRGLRSFDDAYRIGGEEFLLCLKEADQKIGYMVLERLRAGLEKKPVSLPDGAVVPVTASFGLVISSQHIAPDDMKHYADKALYQAKHEGPTVS